MSGDQKAPAEEYDLTVFDLFHMANRSEHPSDVKAASMLHEMVDGKMGLIHWSDHLFGEPGAEFHAESFVREHGDDTPITRTLTSYISDFLSMAFPTSRNLGFYIITHLADPGLDYVKPKGL